MARDRFVVAGAHFLPQREARLAQRRVPRAAGPREVFARSRVVHRGRAAGRRDHRLAPLQRRARCRSACRSSRRSSCRSAPGSTRGTRRRPRSCASGSWSRCSIDRVDRLAGEDALADELHLVLDAVQLVDTPRVRLVEVEIDPVERGGEQLVAVAADRVVRVRPAARTRRVGTRRASRTRRSQRRPRRASAASSGRRARRGCGRTVCRRPRRRPASAHASAWRRAATTPCATPSRSVASMLAKRVGHAFHARARDVPVVVGLEAHEVEALPDLLHRAADDPQRAEVFLGVVEVDVALQPVAHHRGCEPVGVRRGVGAVEARDRARARGRRAPRCPRARSPSSRGRGR